MTHPIQINTQFLVINTQNSVVKLFDKKHLLDKVQIDVPEESSLEEVLDVLEEFRTQDSLALRAARQIQQIVGDHNRLLNQRSQSVDKEYASWLKYYEPTVIA